MFQARLMSSMMVVRRFDSKECDVGMLFDGIFDGSS